MGREQRIEQRGCEVAEQHGHLTPKLGYDGWPDRLHVWAPGRHFWVEWKTPDGTLTPAQRNRIPKLRERGETVFIFDAHVQMEELLWMLT